MSTALNWPRGGNGIHLHWRAAEKQTETLKEETMKNLPKMRDPHLTPQDIDLVFDLPGAVENFLKVWGTEAETREAFRHLAVVAMKVTKAFELLAIKHPRIEPEYLYEYSNTEQSEWILELSSYPIHLSEEMRRAESLVVIAGQVQKFLDLLGVHTMGEEYRRWVRLNLHSQPIHDLRRGFLKTLCDSVGFKIAKTANDGESDFTCVVPQLYEMLKNSAETHPAVLAEREAFMIQNFELIGEARDKVLPGWDGEDYEDYED